MPKSNKKIYQFMISIAACGFPAENSFQFFFILAVIHKLNFIRCVFYLHFLPCFV